MQLHAAASRGDIPAMAFALEKGTDIDARNGAGQTALLCALERMRAFSQWRGPRATLATVQFLLDAGASLEAADSLGATAIHHAAKVADTEVLELMLARGGNPLHVTPSGYSVLVDACYQPASPVKLRMVERLHKAGTSLNATSDHGESPLSVCLFFADLPTLRLLLDLGADPTPLQWSATHHTVAFGSLDELRRRPPSVTSINTKNPRFELSPWLLSFIRGDLDTIRWLAERDADLTQTGRCGISPLHLAAQHGHPAATAWLLDLGADPNFVDDFGNTPLHSASEWDRVSCAAVLLRHGAQPRHENPLQAQPIHAARSLEMLHLLTELGGADVNAIDGCGDWPLSLAAADNDSRRVAWLLGHGAEVNLTSTGATALHAAVAADAREVMDILLANGADPNATDVDGWTPLFSAASREAIGRLLEAGANPGLTDQAGWGPERWLKDPILLSALKGK